MTRLVWLASYPKSGSTWFRMLLANLSATNDTPVDINKLPEPGGIASGRELFDTLTLIESGVLTGDEAAVLRPSVYEALKMSDTEQILDEGRDAAGEEDGALRFMKVHDAYTITPSGKPLLAAAERAIVIVRDPRGIAPSLAHHLNATVDEAIAFMGSQESAFCRSRRKQPQQLLQVLLSWSAHVESWINQRDLPVHLVRYEDLHSDPEGVFHRALRFAGHSATSESVQRAVRLADFAGLKAQESDRGFREARAATMFFRKGKTEAWRDELSAEQIARIEVDHAEMMIQLRYLPDVVATRKRSADVASMGDGRH